MLFQRQGSFFYYYYFFVLINSLMYKTPRRLVQSWDGQKLNQTECLTLTTRLLGCHTSYLYFY